MNIVITGASSGVGFEMAKRFAVNSGNRIFVVARSQKRLEELSGLSPHRNIVPVRLDLSDLKFDALLTAIQNHKVDNIDILVNNAGILINKPLTDLVADDWREVYNTNVFAPALLTSALMQVLGKGVNPSHVVMIGSMGGVSGTAKFPGLSAYSSSKGALGILGEVMAEELRERNIRVNTIALGSVQTEMLEKAFPGYVANAGPAEVAAFICRFCEEGWRLFNGKTLEMSTGTP
jgi:3-oxoacyl-[acyl-carrier protein] reductase